MEHLKQPRQFPNFQSWITFVNKNFMFIALSPETKYRALSIWSRYIWAYLLNGFCVILGERKTTLYIQVVILKMDTCTRKKFIAYLLPKKRLATITMVSFISYFVYITCLLFIVTCKFVIYCIYFFQYFSIYFYGLSVITLSFNCIRFVLFSMTIENTNIFYPYFCFP